MDARADGQGGDASGGRTSRGHGGFADASGESSRLKSEFGFENQYWLRTLFGPLQ